MNPKSPKEILLNLAAALDARAAELDSLRMLCVDETEDNRFHTRARTLSDVAHIFRAEADSNPQ